MTRTWIAAAAASLAISAAFVCQAQPIDDVAPRPAPIARPLPPDQPQRTEPPPIDQATVDQAMKRLEEKQQQRDAATTQPSTQPAAESPEALRSQNAELRRQVQAQREQILTMRQEIARLRARASTQPTTPAAPNPDNAVPAAAQTPPADQGYDRGYNRGYGGYIGNDGIYVGRGGYGYDDYGRQIVIVQPNSNTNPNTPPATHPTQTTTTQQPPPPNAVNNPPPNHVINPPPNQPINPPPNHPINPPPNHPINPPPNNPVKPLPNVPTNPPPNHPINPPPNTQQPPERPATPPPEHPTPAPAPKPTERTAK